jgi:hypothetical protein
MCQSRKRFIVVNSDKIGQHSKSPLLERASWTSLDTIGLINSGADGSRTRVRPSYLLPTHSQA